MGAGSSEPRSSSGDQQSDSEHSDSEQSDSDPPWPVAERPLDYVAGYIESDLPF